MKRRKRQKLSAQVNKKLAKKATPKQKQKGQNRVVSTGSTLLDLAISGGVYENGGIPTGILVEIFGPSGAGKTVLLCQIAGEIQKLNGGIMFHDPEARLNKQFARMFGLNFKDIEYTIPQTVTQVFKKVRDWVPDKQHQKKPIYGVFADSLAALSTDMEMGKDEGDKMGMRRAKEFSEELRKTCRIITQKNILMIGSNQVRQNLNAGPYGMRYKSPGGEAIGFYSSLRLRCSSPSKLKIKKKIKSREHQRVVGVKTNIEVFKSSVWQPHRNADVYIIYDYGIDDIRANLRFLKTNTSATVYKVGNQKLDRSLDKSIQIVEEDGLEQDLKKEVIGLWNEIEGKFASERKPRMGG